MPLIKELQKGFDPKNPEKKAKVVVLGSGGLSIGQAGEFDYSGTQAVKALLEEDLEVIIINPNIATVQTNPNPGTKVYLYPVTAEWVEKVFELEKPQAIVAGFGGQTGLNCLLDLEDAGILKKHGVINLGTPATTLRMTEDRDLFAREMDKVGIPTPPSKACDTLAEAIEAANSIGYPVICRAAYALGGLGSGFAENNEELTSLVEAALANSPQVLIEKSLKGWKEVEYEVMRDGEGNVITICNMENFDPLGIHTGDSIVVCPSQSLSDDEYQLLRNASIKMINALGVHGECNTQFALSPDSLDYYIIEVNARLSRSSALASKASGYPIAYIAAKVVLGYDLLELKNPVTGVTCAFFEPALDYVTIKVPRWDLSKFKGANRELGSTMKSVGEIMSIGRTFPEAIQKAVRMVTEIGQGISFFNDKISEDDLKKALAVPTDTRLYQVIQAFRQGYNIDFVHDITKIDKWFLFNLLKIVKTENSIAETVGTTASTHDEIISRLTKADLASWKTWKEDGFSDEQIANVALNAAHKENKNFGDSEIISLSLELREIRKEKGVVPVVKKLTPLQPSIRLHLIIFTCLMVVIFMTRFQRTKDKEPSCLEEALIELELQWNSTGAPCHVHKNSKKPVGNP